MYSPMPRRNGRDSMRVRFRPANANTARQETSQPGGPEPAPQNTSDVLAGPGRGRGRRVGRRRQPGEAGGVAGVVLEVLGHHHRAVAARGQPRADRRPRAFALAGHVAHGVGGRDGGDHRRARNVLGQPARALAERLGVRADDGDLLERQLAARGQAVGHRLEDLADQHHVRRLQREAVEHRVHAALERVLDRGQRALQPALLDGQHDVAQGRERDGLELRPRGGQRLVADRAGGPGRRRGRVPSLPQDERADLTGESAPHGLLLLGRELVLAPPAVDLLAVQPGRVAMGDRRQHDPVVVGIEQRQ